MDRQLVTADAGDVVEIAGHRLGEHGTMAEILEVLGEASHRHYRVRWDDGRESIFFPGSDATIRHAARRHPSANEDV